jgi:hypothetical protein
MKLAVENWQKRCLSGKKLTGIAIPASGTMTANNSNGYDNNSHAGHNMSSMNEAQSKSTLQPLLDAYYAIKNALVASDASASAVAKRTLLSAMKSVDMSKMEMKQHMEFMKVNTKIIADAQKIADLKRFKKSNEKFSKAFPIIFIRWQKV